MKNRILDTKNISPLVFRYTSSSASLRSLLCPTLLFLLFPSLLWPPEQRLSSGYSHTHDLCRSRTEDKCDATTRLRHILDMMQVISPF